MLDPVTERHCTANNCASVGFFAAVITHQLSAPWLAARPSRPRWREILFKTEKRLFVQLATHTVLLPHTSAAAAVDTTTATATATAAAEI